METKVDLRLDVKNIWMDHDATRVVIGSHPVAQKFVWSKQISVRLKEQTSLYSICNGNELYHTFRPYLKLLRENAKRRWIAEFKVGTNDLLVSFKDETDAMLFRCAA